MPGPCVGGIFAQAISVKGVPRDPKGKTDWSRFFSVNVFLDDREDVCRPLCTAGACVAYQLHSKGKKFYPHPLFYEHLAFELQVGVDQAWQAHNPVRNSAFGFSEALQTIVEELDSGAFLAKQAAIGDSSATLSGA